MTSRPSPDPGTVRWRAALLRGRPTTTSTSPAPALLAVVALLSTAGTAAAADPAILIRAARVHRVSAPPLVPGEVLVSEGRISAVGRGLSAPTGARVVEHPGDLFPGLIEGGAPLGVTGNSAEEFRELTPEMRAADGVDRDSRELSRAHRSGVTVAAVTAGDRNVLGGLGAVLKTAPGRRAADLVRADAFLSATLTLSATQGNLNLRSSPPYSIYHRLPTTRMGTVFLLRRAIFEALDATFPAGEEEREAAGLAPLLTPRGKEALASTLGGGRPLRFRAQTRQEIEAALRIAAEFKVQVVLEGFAEGMDLVREVAARRIRVLIAPPFDPGDEPDRPGVRTTLRLAELLEDAGVEFGFATGSGRETARLRERLGLSLRGGLDPERTLRAATLGTARVLGVEARVGSIEPGKDADLVAVAGDPLDPRAPVAWVMVDGRMEPVDGPAEAP